jgi:hypothetical protein
MPACRSAGRLLGVPAPYHQSTLFSFDYRPKTTAYLVPTYLPTYLPTLVYGVRTIPTYLPLYLHIPKYQLTLLTP